ncbi:hypothetical protein I7I48_05315 [Histoplasma ohiense]|nr:hypothetical protein I7I48_05315 [Histoplasma ohiense (nom. inval.)]
MPHGVGMDGSVLRSRNNFLVSFLGGPQLVYAAVRTARIIQCSRPAWENKAVSNIYFRSAMRVSESHARRCVFYCLMLGYHN